MDRSEWDEPLDADYSAAVPLEISDETAAMADDLLREFAESAALETALVVDRSGGLVAGISSEAEVSVDVISALVAGASGAMQALVSHLGESGALESIHLGGNRLIYLKETVNRFILVAVAEASRPAGLVRQTALSIEARLAEVLHEVRSPEPLPQVPRGRSLRAAASAKAAPAIFPVIAGGSRFAEESIEELPIPLDEAIGEEMDFATFELDESELEEDEAPEIEAEDEEEEIEAAEEQEEEEPQDEAESEEEEAEPNEILEPIDFGDPEIVIERSERPQAQDSPIVMMPVDSPFEAEEEDESDESEFEELVEEEIGEAELPPSLPESVFEWESDEEDLEDEPEAEEETEPAPGPPPLPELVFEEEIEKEEVKAVFELDGFEEDDGEDEEESEDVAEPESEPEPEDEHEDDPSDEVGDEIEEMISEEEEESEIQSSGPFYF
ncbi:MAG TPA: roadblock/LC7 domain-containing protein [Bacteroidia bacterium]|nr:roadblock/LC7 domain-containing protein [Bacteroidia bacterium]